MAANSYDAASGILTDQVWSLWDVGKPQVMTELMARYGYQNQGLYTLWRSMARELPVSGTNFYGYEDNKYHRSIHVKTTTGDPGVGNDHEFILDSQDLDASNRFYVRVGDILTIPNAGEVNAHVYEIDVTTPTAPVVKIRPVVITENIGVLTSGDAIPITGAAFGAGTGQPDGTVVGTIKRSFKTQIIKETVGAEGDQLAQEEWYKVYRNGDVKGWFTKGTMRGDYLMQLKIDGMVTIGKESTNTALVVPTGEDGAGNTINTTKGVVPHLRSGGLTQNYTGGAFDMDDLRDIGKYMRSQYVNSGNILVMSGVDLSNDVNDAAKDFFITDTGSSVMTSIANGMFGGAENMKGVLNFKVINMGDGFNYFIYVMDNWSNPETFKLLDYDEKGVIMPVTSFKNPVLTPGARNKVENFNIRYRASQDGYSRRFEMWTVGGAGGGTYVTAVDSRNWYWRAELGVELYKTNQGVVIEE